MSKSYVRYTITVAVLTTAFLLLTWRAKAARVAEDYLDIMEIGDNQGWSDKLFEQMMKSVGWKSGEAWCMYFVKGVYLNAFPKRADKINKVLNGSTQQSWRNAKESDVFKVVTDGKPKPGDIVIWQSLSNPSQGHAGIVKRHKYGDVFVTVEGNTSKAGAREGQTVLKADRNLVPGSVTGSLKLLGFLRLKLI